MSDLTTTVPAMTPVVISQYEAIKNDIIIAEQKSAGMSFNYRDPKENKAARSHVHSLRTIKGAIEKAREEAKKFALDYGRRVDSAATELKNKVEALIKPHAEAIEKIDAEESARTAKHQAVIYRMVNLRTEPGKTSAEIAAILEKLKAFDTATLEEFKAAGDDERFKTVIEMEKSHAAALTREAEAAELARLRAEAQAREEADRLERIQREAVEAERRRAEAAERKRIEQEAAARAAAEAKAKAEAQRVEREHKAAIEAAERRELEVRLAQEKAERERVEAIRRAEESERREKEHLARMESEAAEKKARREAQEKAAEENRAKVLRAIKADIVKSGDKVAEAIITGKIRHVRVDWENQ